MLRTMSLVILVAAAACGKSSSAPEAKPAEAAAAVGSAKPAAPAPAPAPAPAAPPTEATAAAVALPGACVDPVKDATARLSQEMAQGPGDPPHEKAGPDVDGDGTSDKLFSYGLSYTTNTLVYVMRGACGHFVGDVGMPPEAQANPTRRSGLIDLKTSEVSACEGNPCGCIPGEMWHRFDGKAYKLDEKASKQSRPKPCDK